MSILACAKLYQISTSTNFLTEGEKTSFDQGITKGLETRSSYNLNQKKFSIDITMQHLYRARLHAKAKGSGNRWCLVFPSTGFLIIHKPDGNGQMSYECAPR